MKPEHNRFGNHILRRIISLAVLLCLALSVPVTAADRYSMGKREKESDLSYTFGDLAAARLAVYGILDERYRTPQPETAEAVSRLDAVKLLWSAFAEEAASENGDEKSDDGEDYHSTARAVMGPVADVPVAYTEQVSWAFRNGIAEGITDTEFGVYPSSETAFVSMLLNVMGYQGQYEYTHALHFAESIGLTPLGLSRNFTLGDAALYLQCAMDLKTADGAPARERMNLSSNHDQTTFPGSMILTPLSAEDAEAQIREATHFLSNVIILRGDCLTKEDMVSIYRRYNQASGEQWYISRMLEDGGFSVLMDTMDMESLSPEERQAFQDAAGTLRARYKTGELTEEEYRSAFHLECAVRLSRGESLTLTAQYNEAWELVCDLDDAFTLYADDAITHKADDFYQRHMSRPGTEKEKVRAAEFAIICSASYAPVAGYDEYGEYYNPDAHSILGFFDRGRIVCDGYASIFQYMMLRSDMECVKVLGSTQPSEKTEKNHAWNKVKVDGQWLNVDVCWSDTGWPNTFDLKSDEYYAAHRHWAVTHTDL